jgi:hypothetical protein
MDAIFKSFKRTNFRIPDHTPPIDWRPVPVSQRWQGCTHTSEELWSVYEGGNSYCQYRQGLAHLIVLNSYTNTSVGSPQYQWLEQNMCWITKSIVPLHRGSSSPFEDTIMKSIPKPWMTPWNHFLFDVKSIWCLVVINMPTFGHTLCGMDKWIHMVRVRCIGRSVPVAIPIPLDRSTSQRHG